jgi:hypothetical protein
MVLIAARSFIRLHMFHYFVDFGYQLEFLFLSDVVDDATIDAIFILPEDKPLKHLKCTF